MGVGSETGDGYIYLKGGDKASLAGVGDSTF